jgi:hypothetical protein
MISIYTWAMRRMLAITLLIAFGSPLVAPLFAATADPEASLPACCRSHGGHHCAMLHTTFATSNGPGFQAPPCPNYPSAFTPVRIATASLLAAPLASIEIHRNGAPSAHIRVRTAGNFAPSANLQRGPPYILT